jgi:hypothetical protein
MLSSIRHAQHIHNMIKRQCSFVHLKKDLIFVSSTITDKKSGFDGQGKLYFENLLDSSCDLARDQFSPIQQVSLLSPIFLFYF